MTGGPPSASTGPAATASVYRGLPIWKRSPCRSNGRIRQVRDLFQAFRSQAGEELVLQDNVFVESLPERRQPLSEAEMAARALPRRRRSPSTDPAWPRQIPIAGTPADVVAIARDYAGWLSESPIPKLFINAEPGALTTGRMRDFCRTWPNQTEITVAGAHFIQEDSPDEIGAAIAAFVRRLRPA